MNTLVHKIPFRHRIIAAWRALFSEKVAQVTINKGDFKVVRANMSEEDFSNTISVIETQYSSRKSLMDTLAVKFSKHLKSKK